jgi:hypothetical protein
MSGPQDDPEVSGSGEGVNPSIDAYFLQNANLPPLPPLFLWGNPAYVASTTPVSPSESASGGIWRPTVLEPRTADVGEAVSTTPSSPGDDPPPGRGRRPVLDASPATLRRRASRAGLHHRGIAAV